MRVLKLFGLLTIMVAIVACGSPEERAADHLAKAREFFEAGDLVKAKLEARNAAQIEPKNAEARYVLALIAEQDEQLREMIGHLLVAIDTLEASETPLSEADTQVLVEARVKLGTLYFFGQAYEQAEEQAAAAMELDPGNADVRVLNARILYKNEDRAGGLAEIERALVIDPNNVDALSLQAAAYAQDDPERAIAIVDDAVARLEPDEAKRLRQIKLVILAQQNRAEDVEAELRSLIADAPTEATYSVQLARLLAAQGRVDEAEDAMRDLAKSDDVNAKLGLVQFLQQVRTAEAAEEALQTFIDEDPENQQLRVALARFYEANEQNEKAVAVYEKVIAMDPKSEQGLIARNRLVSRHLRDNDLDAARVLVEEILADAPDNADALLVRAGLYFTDERYDDAVSDLRVVIRKEPENERALLLLARTHLRADDNVLAKDGYRRLLEVNPNHADGSRELVAIAVQEGDLDEAEDILRRLTEANPDDVVSGARLVEVLVLQDDWEAAEAEARRIAATEDSQGIGSFQLGRVLEVQKKYAEASQAFLDALDKNPAAIQMLQGLARSLNAQGKEDETITYLREQVEEYPDQLGARLLLGGALSGQGETEQAAAMFEEVIAARPAAPAGYIALAGLYRHDAANRIATYQRGLEAIPANPQIGLLLASEYERQARFDDAISLYENLLAANPDLVLAQNNLAALLLDFRYEDPAEVDRAVGLAEKLVEADNPAMMDTVGWAYYRSGDTAKAVNYLERAVAAAGEVPVLRYHLGMAYLAADNPVGAQRELDKALTLAENADFIGKDEAQEALDSLENT